MELLNNKNENNSATLKWIFKNSKRYMVYVVVISIFAAIISSLFVALAWISKEILDIATNVKQGSIVFYGILLFSVVIFQIVLNIVDVLMRTYAKEKLLISFRNNLFSAISRRKYSEVSCYHSGDLLNRLTSDIDVVTTGVINIIPNIASMLAKIIGGTIALLILNWRIAIIILLVGISVPAIGRFVNRKYKALHKECQKTEGRTRSFLQECFENIVVLKAFESERTFAKKLNSYMDISFRKKMKRSGISILTNMGLYTFFTVGYYAILLWGAGEILLGSISYGTLTAFLQLLSQLRAPLQNISGVVPQYFSAIASAERLIELETGISDKPCNTEKICEIKQNFSGIEINNIKFAYKDKPILNGISFAAEKGKITAIVGESGSGKSTIFKLLLGLYELDGGSITVNKDIPLDTSLRGIFAYVPQGNMILSGTVRENLTLCNEGVTDEQIEKALKAAEIYDTIVALPEAFDTQLSERGAGLSEGQLQRISIARALLADSPVLLFDEATSALDEATETAVLRNIKAMNEKTVIFVTHRNTSLSVCDKIVNIEKYAD